MVTRYSQAIGINPTGWRSQPKLKWTLPPNSQGRCVEGVYWHLNGHQQQGDDPGNRSSHKADATADTIANKNSAYDALCKKFYTHLGTKNSICDIVFKTTNPASCVS